MSNEQTVLANRLKVCSFVLLETALFLDTHPTDQDALAYYKRYNELYTQAKNDYVSKYGPITHSDFDGGDRWTWVDGPWPWQQERED